MRLVLALLLVAGAGAGARAECWDYQTTDEVLGVAKDGSFVLRTTAYTSAGGGHRTELEFVDPKGLSTGLLLHCDGGEECGPEGWSAKGPAKVPAGNPTPKQAAADLVTKLGLTPVVRASGKARVVFVEDDKEQAIILGKETLAVTPSPIQEEVQDYMKGRAEVFTHPATRFRFVRLSFKDHCSHDRYVEKQVTARLILVLPDGPKALALSAEAVRLLDKDKLAPAVAKLSEAVKLEPSYLRARAQLADALARSEADWKTARAALDVPRPRLVRTTCVGLEDQLPDRWSELYEWWRDMTVRLGCR